MDTVDDDRGQVESAVGRHRRGGLSREDRAAGRRRAAGQEGRPPRGRARLRPELPGPARPRHGREPRARRSRRRRCDATATYATRGIASGPDRGGEAGRGPGPGPGAAPAKAASSSARSLRPTSPAAIEAATGVTVDRRKITLDEPLKALGPADVEVTLHSDVRVTVTVEVVAELRHRPPDRSRPAPSGAGRFAPFARRGRSGAAWWSHRRPDCGCGVHSPVDDRAPYPQAIHTGFGGCPLPTHRAGV